MDVLDNNEPVYIEDFRREQPDWANDYLEDNSAGDPDPDIDWLPAFKRAAYYHLTTDPSEALRFKRTYQRLVFVGRTRSQYNLSDTLHLFSIRLEGLYPRVELNFDNNTDGIHIHHPWIDDERPGTSYNLPGPATKYGGRCTLRNLKIRGTARMDLTDAKKISSVEGKRGIIIQHRSLLDAVEVLNFGWHGFHVTADVTRAKTNIDGAHSNANGTTLLNCRATRCGYWPGTDTGLVSEANPKGNRPFGSGLRLQGGDANICYTRSFDGSHCARWAIDDVGFLGNKHDLPHTAGCYHNITQWESDISSHPNATRSEKRDFNTYDVPVNNPALFSYHIDGRDARSVLSSPYVESNRVEVFQVGLEYFPDLEKCIVSSSFREEFKRNNIDLPENARIEFRKTIDATDNRGEIREWKIITFNFHCYIVRSIEEDETITIYTNIIILDVRKLSFVISGIGGKDWQKTKRIKSGQFTNSWKFTANSEYDTYDETVLSEDYGTFLTLKSHGDNLKKPYRLKYVHFLNDYDMNDLDDPDHPEDPEDPDRNECPKIDVQNSKKWAGFYRLDRAGTNKQIAFALTGSKSFEKTTKRVLTRRLDPGRLVLTPHYRAIGITHFRRVEYGEKQDLSSIEASLPADKREIGDSYTCLKPKSGGIYEAVVIEDPSDPTAKIWAAVSRVQA